jgi:hypothetical protein
VSGSRRTLTRRSPSRAAPSSAKAVYALTSQWLPSGAPSAATTLMASPSTRQITVDDVWSVSEPVATRAAR